MARFRRMHTLQKLQKLSAGARLLPQPARIGASLNRTASGAAAAATDVDRVMASAMQKLAR